MARSRATKTLRKEASVTLGHLNFWSALKLDLVYRRDFDTRTQARTEIFDYVQVFYNRERIHTAIRGLSPTQLELKNN